MLRRTSCRASPNLRPVSAETSVPCCLFHHWRIMDSPLRHGSFHRALPTGGVTTTVFIPYSLIPIPFLTPARPCRPATGAIHSDRPSCRGVAHPSRCDHPATYRCQWRTRGSPLRLGSFHRALPAGGVITSVDQRSSPGGHAWNSSRMAPRTGSRSSTWAYCGVGHHPALPTGGVITTVFIPYSRMSGETPDLLFPLFLDPCYLFPLHPPAWTCRLVRATVR